MARAGSMPALGPVLQRRDVALHATRLPTRPGIGYKPQHFAAIMADPAPICWLEVHAENYMGDGGRPLAQLRNLAERG